MVGMVGSGNDTATTALQNLVIAFNSVNRTLQYINGQFTSETYPAVGLNTAVIFQGRSRVVAINVIVAGGTVSLYDSSSASIITPASLKVALDSSAAIGTYPVGAEFANGIVLDISGAGEVNVTYSVY